MLWIIMNKKGSHNALNWIDLQTMSGPRPRAISKMYIRFCKNSELELSTSELFTEYPALLSYQFFIWTKRQPVISRIFQSDDALGSNEMPLTYILSPYLQFKRWRMNVILNNWIKAIGRNIVWAYKDEWLSLHPGTPLWAISLG